MAEFKHAVFISYRNGKSNNDTLNTFAEQLHEALLDVVAMLDIVLIF